MIGGNYIIIIQGVLMLKIKDIVKRHTKPSINILWLINENVFFPLRFGVELD